MVMRRKMFGDGSVRLVKLEETTVVTCNKRISVTQKRMVYEVAVMKKEKRMDVAEIKILRWTCGHTRLEQIGN